jgi:NAD dependent epimerase/dehydratase family enzyme
MSEYRIALLGTGYTLEKVAELLNPDSIVLVCSSKEREGSLVSKGYRVERLNAENKEQLIKFFTNYPNLETLVDSIPPTPKINIASVIKELSLNLKRIIYLSTTGVYGVEDGSWVDENLKLNPKHSRSKLRVAAEEAYRSLKIPSTALRIAAIYGPGRGIGHALKAGRYPLIGDGSHWSNRIQVADLAAAIVAAIKYPGVLPSAINLADDKPSTSKEIVDFYCNKFNFSEPQSISLEQALERGLETMLSNQRISNKLLHETLLPELKFPSFREGAETEFQ